MKPKCSHDRNPRIWQAIVERSHSRSYDHRLLEHMEGEERIEVSRQVDQN
ncbi:hypothetical protein HanXRQr2_Chr15g0676131 [Helianthus annuus]|uniref:Uncharacterized protein n=1 Tax=Helianthus annuus TaxID=4232 RepID=A0A9K3H0U4_HELAN|nr:hypothetical protein HanXRQr2_Chr15g0676131 [Helianthus annuus]